MALAGRIVSPDETISFKLYIYIHLQTHMFSTFLGKQLIVLFLMNKESLWLFFLGILTVIYLHLSHSSIITFKVIYWDLYGK